MKQLLQNLRSGDLRLADIPAPAALAGGVLVRNRHSVVSAGTDRTTVGFARQSLLGKARARPDLVRQVVARARREGLRSTYHAVTSRLDQDATLGYSCAGEIVELGEDVDSLNVGEFVACAGHGYASHAEFVWVPVNLTAPIPAGVAHDHAAFATLGAIALQGIRRTELTPGESVAVIGLGLIGQLTVQILKAYGFPTFGLDINEAAVQLARDSGIDAAWVIGQGDQEAIAASMNGGRGIDAAIVTAATSSSEPVELAGQLLRERGRLTVVGDVGIEIPRRVFYDKELDVRVSRSYGPGRHDPTYEEHGIDYPYPYVRWTEQRNMVEFLRLLDLGRMDLNRLITHRFPIDRGEEAYRLVVDNPDSERVVGVVIDYAKSDAPPVRTKDLTTSGDRRRRTSGTVSVGLIGAGNFVRTTILPSLRRIKGIQIRGVAAASGNSANDLASKCGAEVATTDYRTLLADPNIDAVIIAVKHNLNAGIAIDVLNAGKHVHVEKPLALTYDELSAVAEASSRSDQILSVGFNRRFAPFVSSLKDHIDATGLPLMADYRVAAGAVPPEHWVHDPVVGGGRILGEVCHFVDLIHFLSGSPPVRVFATRPTTLGDQILSDDNVLVAIDFENGSRGSILYTAMGAPRMPKERLEVLSGDRSAILDDFKTMELFSGNSRSSSKSSQDKGHLRQFKAFFSAIRDGSRAPVDAMQLLLSTSATIAIEDSLRTGEPVEVRQSFHGPSPGPGDEGPTP